MFKIKIEAGRQISLPAAICEQLSLAEGDILVALVREWEVRLLPRPAALRFAQAIVRQYVPEGVSLVDELLEERRHEVSRESDT
jgi:bifunctional DNA-binding transcriptional regulator/antitoxin component of YhaV-PrlF toxin-antitoxin module